MHRGRFSATSVLFVNRKKKEKPSRRSSDSCLCKAGCDFCVKRSPSQFPSDWLSPKNVFAAHTAAVPFGILTRLSCSADKANRSICHEMVLSSCRS